MKAVSSFALLAHALAANGARILQGNDDGWAELYVRSFNDALNAAGHSVILSCPAENRSGSSSLDSEPSPRSDACQYSSCAPHSGPIGVNASNPSLHWVNSYPVTAIRYGLDLFAPQAWAGAAPDIVVAGPNVGSNLFLQLPFSGTVGVATHAAHNAGIPAIAFSGLSTGNLAWDVDPAPLRSSLYAQLAAFLTDKVLASGAPYLPPDVFLNVNFPKVEGQCTTFESFRWVLSRVDPGWFSAPDVHWCGSTRLPTELDVIGTDGCYISVSIGDAADKTTINDDRQDAVLAKLKDILTCLPK
ncbi:Acid phosphatase [Escovopsis weberi]|uniref:Acid phosphatase n=1 Tax=Escovopsis weberi TaxID=150374 RepID=A0A0M8MUT4_ESCWE|nr:Acid phosphatase [Escovopsis weberi]